VSVLGDSSKHDGSDLVGVEKRFWISGSKEHCGDFAIEEIERDALHAVFSSVLVVIGCSHEYRSITFGLSWPYTFDVAFYRTLPSLGD
jgi:hypothetical protein